jgi:hypothetical protein
MNEYESYMKNSVELGIIDSSELENKESSKSKTQPLLTNNKSKKEEEEQKKILIENINIHTSNPRKIGKTWGFFYYKDYPLIVIGPDCK